MQLRVKRSVFEKEYKEVKETLTELIRSLHEDEPTRILEWNSSTKSIIEEFLAHVQLLADGLLLLEQDEEEE
jgi:hypothetical protein